MTHVHHWVILYDDIDGGCIRVYALCECGKRIEKNEIEALLNGHPTDKTGN